MHPITGEVLIVAGLVLAQGLLALAEAALSGSRKSRLKEWAARGNRGAEAAIRLGEDPRGIALTLQAGITLLGSFAGVYAGAVLQPELSRVIGQGRLPAAYRDAIGVVSIAVLIGLATLVVGDVIPRRVALHRPESIARVAADYLTTLNDLIDGGM